MTVNPQSNAGGHSHNRSCDPKGAFMRSSPRNAKQSDRLVQPSASRLLSTVQPRSASNYDDRVLASMIGRGRGQSLVGVSESSVKRLAPPSTIGGQSFLPALGLKEEKSYPKQVFTGKSIDQVYGKNHDDLVKLQDENKLLKSELSQIKPS